MIARFFLALLALTSAVAADAQTVQLCPGRSAVAAPDGRVFGHYPYGEASPAELVDAPPGFADNRGCKLRAVLTPDLERLLAAVRAAPEAAGTLVGISCYRPIARQQAVFCADVARDAQDGVLDADRAISVGPPGHSEHATGYAIDFGVRPSNGCPDAEACMAATPAARWLLANAGRFGFELSFPPGSKQNVKWEPWHWRWVGTTASAPGAAAARFLFARARRFYPANPAVDPVVVVAVAAQPPLVALPAPPAELKGKRKRRRR